MDDGISESLRVASLGIDYTFRFFAKTANLTIDIIKYLCEKKMLKNQEKSALELAMQQSPNVAVTIKNEDLEDFKKLAESHNIQYSVASLSTSKNPDVQLNSILFKQDNIQIMNTILDALNYEQLKDEGINEQKKDIPLEKEFLQQEKGNTISNYAVENKKEGEIIENIFEKAAKKQESEKRSIVVDDLIQFAKENLAGKESDTKLNLEINLEKMKGE